MCVGAMALLGVSRLTVDMRKNIVNYTFSNRHEAVFFCFIHI